MVKKWLLVFLLICSPLKSFDLSENCPKEFVSGTFFGPAAVCAFYALIVHPFLNNDSKKPKVSTTVTLGAAGLY
ncbi:hypothetical protein EBU95_18390, partial [bacterium]|nr:hypothetical protein [bacterium]